MLTFREVILTLDINISSSIMLSPRYYPIHNIRGTSDTFFDTNNTMATCDAIIMLVINAS